MSHGQNQGYDASEKNSVYGRYPKKQPKYQPNTESGEGAARTQASIVLDLPKSGGVSDTTWNNYLRSVSSKNRPFVEALQSGGDRVHSRRGYVKFLLESVQEPKDEKVQVTESLSDTWIAHFFGEKARMWRYSGKLFNTMQDQWYDAWSIIYNNFLRGTKLAEAGLLARLEYNDKHVYGALVNTSTQLRSGNETIAPFSFSLLVADVQSKASVQPSDTTPRAEPETGPTDRLQNLTQQEVENARQETTRLSELSDQNDDYRDLSESGGSDEALSNMPKYVKNVTEGSSLQGIPIEDQPEAQYVNQNRADQPSDAQGPGPVSATERATKIIRLREEAGGESTDDLYNSAAQIGSI